MFFRRKKKPEQMSYDPDRQRPVIRCSICTGEEVAGFRDLETGRFTEVQLLTCSRDLEDFMARYGISQQPPREY